MFLVAVKMTMSSINCHGSWNLKDAIMKYSLQINNSPWFTFCLNNLTNEC